MILLRNLRLKPLQCFLYEIPSVFDEIPTTHLRKVDSLVSQLTCRVKCSFLMDFDGPKVEIEAKLY